MEIKGIIDYAQENNNGISGEDVVKELGEVIDAIGETAPLEPDDIAICVVVDNVLTPIKQKDLKRLKFTREGWKI